MAAWDVLYDEEFDVEVLAFPETVRLELLAMAQLLSQFGPDLKRPHSDTLKGSSFKNMKELRFAAADGQWRVAYAFDPRRKAILLVAGDKSGVSGRRFYKVLIGNADARYRRHLSRIGSR